MMRHCILSPAAALAACRLTNQLRFMPGGDGSSCASSSYDGTVKVCNEL